MKTFTADPVPDTGYALRDQLGFKLSRTSRLMQQRLEAALGTKGVSRLQWCVLSSIGLEGLSTPSDIAENLGVTRPMLSKLIKAMTQDGLVQRKLDADDGRNRRLSLTRKGTETLNACRPLVQENNAHFEAKLSRAQLDTLHQIAALLTADEDTYVDRL